MLVCRCSSELSGHRLQGKIKSHSLRPERSEVEGHAVHHVSTQRHMEASPFPLSSRAKPRDLQFSGLVLEMSVWVLTGLQVRL